jgi:hypothetical protein
VLVPIVLSSCAFFSDGAVVDYSKMFNFSPVFTVGGDVQGEALGPDYKQHRIFEAPNAASPWSSVDVHGTTFNHFKGAPTVVCRTISGIQFCN